MCGIVSGIAQENILPVLLEGLMHLEYRGYDSAGIVIIDSLHRLQRFRSLGNIQKLKELLEKNPLKGNVGIAHTRWATHGIPSVENAHPHVVGNEIALVHNGIIENHLQIRAQLEKQSCIISSQTDSELIAHLIYLKIKAGQHFLSAVRNTTIELQGTYALGILYRAESNRIIAARNGSSLVIGLGNKANYIASDVVALLSLTNRFIYLEDGDIADVYVDKVIIYNAQGEITERGVHSIHSNNKMTEKGKYQHYMQKEIYEQPHAISATLQGRISKDHIFLEMFGDQSSKIFKDIQRIQIVACGTSYYAGLVGAYWLEELAGIPCQVEIASENRYRHKVIEPGTLFVTISQSGETADTLAALRRAKVAGYVCSLTICNVAESSIVRESDLVFITNAGQEIGVASTKAFTTQLTALLLLTLCFMRCRCTDKKNIEKFLVKNLFSLPNKIEKIFQLEPTIKKLAQNLTDKTNALYIARGIQLPIAMEGALKLKEISYIHAEAYPAGELKHGVLALVDPNMPVIALAPYNHLLKKIESNMEEARTRKGQLIIFTDTHTGIKPQAGTEIIILPSIDSLLTPFIYVIPLQLLAYHVAVLKGNNVDQPRNLAKSVTVE